VLAKPHGCRQFPLTLVDDGRAIQVSVAPECACVLDFADAADGQEGEPLLAAGATRAADLDPRTHVHTLAAEVELDGAGRRWSRERYLDWLLKLEGRAAEPGLDVAALLWSAGVAFGRGDSAQPDELTVAPPCAELLSAAVGDLGGALARRLAVDGWRAPTDLAWRVPRWMQQALEELDGAEVAVQPAVERLYLQSLTHGRTLVPRGERVDRALCSRALRLLVARRMTGLRQLRNGRAEDRALGQPLALVEGYARAFGLG
jgi:lysine-N-methylase